MYFWFNVSSPSIVTNYWDEIFDSDKLQPIGQVKLGIFMKNGGHHLLHWRSDYRNHSAIERIADETLVTITEVSLIHIFKTVFYALW